ncbi:MMPL family transporter [Vibrio hippocampi]|uniref:Membrane transport protein MMPL domain-containing protein n=1 Tax=Vibrio hippocampi TaxID=654686 RepID=A0ABM8ZLB8_9VIBR|nr:MMPL family transporter [Vibrio hippocampi]CAH0529165.1 hypothetical protein VHP8226_03083 [Vibrio hippocampi]
MKRLPLPSITVRAYTWLGLVLLCIALLIKQWMGAVTPIETDILKLLPKSQQNPIVDQAFQSVADNLSNKVVFALTAPSEQQLFSAAEQFTAQLGQSAWFHGVTGKVDQEKQAQWSRYYFQHRFQNLTEAQRTRLQQAPEQQVTAVIQQVYNPFSGVTGSELNSDPFLLFREYLGQVNQLSQSLTLKNDYLYREFNQQPYIMVMAQLTPSPYSTQGSEAVAFISELETQLQQQFQASVSHTGVVFYADFGTQSAKSEISTIGVVSLLGVILLILSVFRSATPLWLALLSIGVGLLLALTATILVFGKVHLFSLVFGASLIGVSIDYAFHYLTERLTAGTSWNSEAGLKHIFIAITLGLLTSLVGYLGMLIAPFPGLQQLAVFSSVGLIAAYATVVCWYPVLARRASKPHQALGTTLWQSWFQFWSKPSVRVVLPGTVLLIGLVLLTQTHYDDDIRQLQALPKSIKQQEQLIAQITGQDASQQMLLVTAADNETLLTKLESLQPQLTQWQAQGVIRGYQSLTQYIKSVETQLQDYQLIQSLYQTQGERLATSLNLTQAPTLEQTFSPMTLSDFIASPVSEPVQFLYLGQLNSDSNPSSIAAAITLNNLTDSAVMKQFAQQQSDIFYLNKAEEVSSLFAEYRIKIFELLAIALGVILIVLSLRYKIKHALMILLPSVIACVASIAITALTGSTLNLFNLLALILIVGIGVDYTLFFAEKRQSYSTLLAVTLSAITTMLSFGLLALSDTHAIHSFGLTVLSGIFFAWLLAPLAILPKRLES